MDIRCNRKLCGVAGLLVAWLQAGAADASGVNVVTYHYDTLRTGWNQNETTLTAANVGSGSFGLLEQVALDQQVDAQPLFVSGQTIQGVNGTYDVVYVATENNTIYAIDANSGNILLSQNFGTAVPESALPGGCNNNSDVVGINSTPVIDPAAGLLYAITYTYENNVPTFRVHAVSLATLQDTMPPPVIGGAGYLKNGRKLPFLGANNRQRSGLLAANGNIYAGFASWCDINADVSHGWVLGWNAGTLAPLAASELVNRLPHTRDNFFLSSVWMSGYGIAADAGGSLYFATGNTDYNGKSYNSVYNLAESVLKLSGDLTTVQSFFTPTGANGWRHLDAEDGDFGSGGVLLLPDQAGAYPHLAVAIGKAGPMYLLNRDNLGGLGDPHVTMGIYGSRSCWCGSSYYVGADGAGRVVESTGSNLDIWKIVTSPKTRLLYDVGAGLSSGQDPGFFTSISSNGTTAGSHVVWAVPRPTGGYASTDWGLKLQAFDPAQGAAVLYRSPGSAAGTWPYGGNANANVVPVVANGHVFVASYENLSIFGLGGQGAAKRLGRAPAHVVLPAYAGTPHDLYGIVSAIDGTVITLRPRNGAPVRVDVAAARAAGDYAPAAIGRAALVRGDYKAGMFVAKYVLHAKQQASLWGPDR